MVNGVMKYYDSEEEQVDDECELDELWHHDLELD